MKTLNISFLIGVIGRKLLSWQHIVIKAIENKSWKSWFLKIPVYFNT